MGAMSGIISSVLNRNLVFVHGKGGVGKTIVSQSIALGLAQKGLRTLWITLEDPTRPPGEVMKISSSLFHANLNFVAAFEEYASMKIGVTVLSKIFLKNKLIRYMAKAAPGVHELVLLGKIWFERNHYEHVVVDLPSTGYGLAMFQSTENFVKLFHGGPLNRDAQSMLETFRDPHLTGHLVVALPEEMPLRESLDLNRYLKELFPKNPAVFLVNRLFPASDFSGESPDPSHAISENPDSWITPFAHSAEEYAKKRFLLERYNLRLWRDEKMNFAELDYVPPPKNNQAGFIVQKLTQQLQTKAYL